MNAKQARFVDEYLLDLNATKAAERAGYSLRTAYSHGQRLLKDVEIAEAIVEAMKARAKRTEIDQDAVLQELAVLLRSDVRHFTVDEEHGGLTLADGAPDSAWRAVSSVKHRRIVRGKDDDKEVTYEVEFKLWDKPASVKMAGQHLAMFTQKHELILPPGAGVLAVPVAPGSEQWAAGAAAQQAALAAQPSIIKQPE